MKLIASAILLGFIAGAPHQASASVAMGVGLSSCGSWTAHRHHPEWAVSIAEGQWVLGFLSALAAARVGDPFNDMDAEGIWAWIDIYCRENPLKPIGVAAMQFFHTHPE